MVCFKKRGLSYADWAMSFALFALYLIWFFLFVIPSYTPKEDTKLPIADLKDSFFELNSLQVKQIPLFILSNQTISNEAIIINNPFSGSRDNYYLSSVFDFDEDKLITVADTNSVIYFLYSEYDYPMPLISYNISANELNAETDRMIVKYDDSVLEELRYKGERKIKGFEINKNPTRSYFDSSSMYAKYKFTASELNHTGYIVGENTKIINFIKPENVVKVKLNLSLYEYEDYYADSDNFGSIDYDSSDCESFESDYIDFYDENGISFVFDNEVDIEMCHDNELEVEFSFDVEEEFRYVIIIHEDDFRETVYYGYTVETGLAEEMTGLSERELISTEDIDYSDLRRTLGFPSNRNFKINVFNVSGADYSYGKTAGERDEVEAEDFGVFMLDEYGNQEGVTLNVQGW
ncbi:hypothetical protein KY339_03985 [Candidatus Woesearchaeota archaeon]|nr:hypothetical protein [Candidatus Woesearchaeota archaeon]